jgi:CHASE2 domain-containing sensor protein
MKKRFSRKLIYNFVHRLTEVLPLIFGMIVFSLIYRDASIFREAENIATTVEMRLKKSDRADSVVLVRITDEEFRSPAFFCGQAPLNVSKVLEIVRVIAGGSPRAIGVTLESTASEEVLRLPTRSPPVVWAQRAGYSHIRKKYVLSPTNAPPRGAEIGVATFTVDSDNLIRRYTRCFDTPSKLEPAFATILSFRGTYRNRIPSFTEADCKLERLIEFTGDAGSGSFLNIPVLRVYELAQNGGLSTLLEGKVVILSADYGLQDEYETPVGWLPASHILASVVDTEERGGGRKPVGVWIVALLGLCGSVVIVLLRQVAGILWALAAGVILTPLLAVVISRLLSGSLAYAGTFTFAVVAALCIEIYDAGKEQVKKWRDRRLGSPHSEPKSKGATEGKAE